ncbi:unnamed protein product [Amoebophrya sp. A120]|nr:unnamed protein product [Amoebophrya sp. A120]|eukprot:GSA120T00016767001.1
MLTRSLRLVSLQIVGMSSVSPVPWFLLHRKFVVGWSHTFSFRFMS